MVVRVKCVTHTNFLGLSAKTRGMGVALLFKKMVRGVHPPYVLNLSISKGVVWWRGILHRSLY